MPKYTVVVDYGKPFDIKVKDEGSLKKELVKLGKQYKANPDEYPYFDVWVYDEKDKDVTDKMFKKLGVR